jgi:cell division protein FtsB
MAAMNRLPVPLVRLAIVACVPLGFLFAISFARIAVADYAIHQQKAKLERDVAALKQENATLKHRIEYLKTDPVVELLAREELGWTRPDDTSIVILTDNSGSVGAATGGSASLVTPAPRR